MKQQTKLLLENIGIVAMSAAVAGGLYTIHSITNPSPEPRELLPKSYAISWLDNDYAKYATVYDCNDKSVLPKHKGQYSLFDLEFEKGDSYALYRQGDKLIIQSGKDKHNPEAKYSRQGGIYCRVPQFSERKYEPYEWCDDSTSNKIQTRCQDE